MSTANTTPCPRCGLPVLHLNDHWHPLSCGPFQKTAIERLHREIDRLVEENKALRCAAGFVVEGRQVDWRNDSGGDEQC